MRNGVGMYRTAMTMVLAGEGEGCQHIYMTLASWPFKRDEALPRFGSMRRKMAKAVEGCWYSLLNVVPGSCSRYSDSEFALFDMAGSER